MKKRVDWIDTARFWGMFFIYLGHFADAAGKAFPWVFSFHVPLFFFLSGCVENYNRRNVAQNLWHKVVHTLLPFYVFGLMSIALNVILTDSQESLSVHLRILLMGGIRNGITLGGGLWFLSCLFVIQIAFSIISQIKSRPVVFAVCLGIYLIAELAVGSLFTLTPHWWYNADSACYYLIYYCVGWFTFPWIDPLLKPGRPFPVRMLKVAMTLACLYYSTRLFFGTDLLAPLSGIHPLLRALCSLVKPLASVWLVVCVSYLFHGPLSTRIGRNSLYMCGNEYIVKTLVPYALAMVGLNTVISVPVQAYLYSFALLIVVDRALVPLEKPLLDRLQAGLSRPGSASPADAAENQR